MCHLCRPRWVLQHGSKYSRSDYVIIGWQEDDLPLFGRINDIMLINGSVLFRVNQYRTLGIDRHYHSFCIRNTAVESVCWHSELVDYHPLQGHRLFNSNLYITLRSHIEKMC